MSWSYGFFRFGVSWGGGYGPYPPRGCCGGWYGGGYRGPVIINTGNINIGNNVNIGNREKISNRIATDKRIKPAQLDRNNIYNRPENRARKADSAVRPAIDKARPSTRPNDVYVDRNGNIMRRDGDQWQSRDKGGWTPDSLPGGDRARPTTPSQRPTTPSQRPTTPSQRPTTPSQRPTRPSQRPSTPSQRPAQRDRSDLNRDYRARQSGASRERTGGFSSGGGMPRGGGGARGGGGGRMGR
jgi:uncharacterized membrane protein YgcG